MSSDCRADSHATISTRRGIDMSTSTTERKVRENRLRRAADRQGLRLMKSPRRDPSALGYGLYALVGHETGGTMHTSAPLGIHTLNLDDVEQYLLGDQGDE
jgi:hypothetical protein